MVIEDGAGGICFRRRPDQGLLGGLIELPTSWLRDRPFTSEAELLAALPDADWQQLPGGVRHVFTHFTLHVVVVVGRPDEPLPDAFFQPRDRLGVLALPTLTRKLLRHAGIAP
jgi:A/G-specific adenine glycosylase